MLTPREIIAQAWTITTTEPSLKRWGFSSTSLRLLLDIKLVGYQIYFIYAYVTGKEVGLFDDFIWLYDRVSVPWFMTILISFGLMIVTELLLPTFCDGAIIGLTAKAHTKEPVKGGFILALYNFFPIFAIHEVFVFSGVNLLITAVSIILRYAGGMASFLVPMAFLLWVISSVLSFFASFAEPAVVIKKAGVFAAIGQSIKLVVSYPWHVFLLLVLLLIISIRIFVNLLLLVLIPAIMAGVGIALTYVFTPAVSYTIAGIIALIATLVAAYFFTYLHVFRDAVWTIMYIELTKEKELDQIG